MKYKLLFKHFQYPDLLTEWVNNNIKVENIISITDKGKYSEGLYLFYKEKIQI